MTSKSQEVAVRITIQDALTAAHQRSDNTDQFVFSPSLTFHRLHIQGDITDILDRQFIVDDNTAEITVHYTDDTSLPKEITQDSYVAVIGRLKLLGKSQRLIQAEKVVDLTREKTSRKEHWQLEVKDLALNVYPTLPESTLK